MVNDISSEDAQRVAINAALGVTLVNALRNVINRMSPENLERLKNICDKPHDLEEYMEEFIKQLGVKSGEDF